MNTFIIIATLILFFINVYCYYSLIKNLLFKKFQIPIFLIFSVLFSFEMSFLLHWSDVNEIIYKISIYSIGFSFMAFCILLPSDILGAIFANRKRRDREVIRFFYDIAVIIGIVAYIYFGIKNAFDIKIQQRQLEIAKLQKPFRAVVISDLHLGILLQKNFSKKIVDIINTQNADAVFIVGDLVDTTANNLKDSLSPFNNINSKNGTFYVSGNHEYYNGATEIFKKIAQTNINMLQNQNAKLDELNIIGVKDISSLYFNEGANITEAMNGIDETKPNILLSHQPKLISMLRQDELAKIDLILSGHTHAGQIFPFSLLVWLAQKYIYGQYDINDTTKLIVTSGVGFWGPPMRILSNSEIVVLDLIPKE